MTKFAWVVIIILIIIAVFAYGRTLTNSSVIDSNNSLLVVTKDSGKQVKLDEIDEINTQIQKLKDLMFKYQDEQFKVCKLMISDNQVTLEQYNRQLEAFKLCLSTYRSNIEAVQNNINSLNQQRATIISGL